MRKVLFAGAAVAALVLVGAGRASAQQVIGFAAPAYSNPGLSFAPSYAGFTPTQFVPTTYLPMTYQPTQFLATQSLYAPAYGLRGPAQPFNYANTFSARYWGGGLSYPAPYSFNSLSYGAYGGRGWGGGGYYGGRGYGGGGYYGGGYGGHRWR